MKKSPTKSYYVKKLDTVFSRYIRQYWSNDFGRIACYTCGMSKEWKEADNGHFISRANMATRWDENNCRPQCKGCNGPRGGEIAFFGQRLQKEIGDKEYQELLARGRSIRQWTVDELKEKIKHYENLVRNLWRNRGTKEPAT